MPVIVEQRSDAEGVTSRPAFVNVPTGTAIFADGFLPVNEAVDRVDRLGADLIGMLDRIAVHRARSRSRRALRASRRSRRPRPCRSSPGGFDRRAAPSAESSLMPNTPLRSLCACKMSSIAALGFGAFAAAVDIGDDLHARATRRDRRFEALDAILHARDFGLVEDRDRPPLFRAAAHISLPAWPPPCTLSLAMCATTLPCDDAFAISAVNTGIFALLASTIALPIACESYGVSTIAATFCEMKSSTWLCCFELSRLASTT